MPTRDDDDLDVVAGLSASREDTFSVQKAAQRNTPSQQPKAAVQSQTRPRDSKSPQPTIATKSGRGVIWFGSFVLLALIVACGWLGQQVFQLQEQLVNNNNALQLERSRMESISAQVHETGSSFEKTGNVLDEKFKFFDSEIRKLWDVSNKRNKSAIEDNSAQVKSLSGSVKKSQQSLSALSSNQNEVKKAVEKLNKQLASENTALRAIVEDQAEQILLVRSEMDLLQKRFSNMPNDLAARVASNEEAVEAIDAGRRQLVARISQLQKQLDTLVLEKDAP